MHILKSLTSQDVEYIVTSRDVERLKHLARKLKRAKALPHHKALDQVAQTAGFSHWHHVCQCEKATQPVEKACYSGCIFSMDAKDAMEPDDVFIEDVRIPLVFETALFNRFSTLPDESDPNGRPLKETLGPDELRDWFQEALSDYVFYRVCETTKIIHVEQLMELTQQTSFWPPIDVWLNGAYFDRHESPAMDGEGNIVGLRF